MCRSLFLSCGLLFACRVTAQSNSTVQVPAEYAYLLPRPFNNSFTQPFVSTTVPLGSVNDTITAARSASFVSYDPEFDLILGDSPVVVELARSNTSFAFEGGIWVPTLDQVVSCCCSRSLTRAFVVHWRSRGWSRSDADCCRIVVHRLSQSRTGVSFDTRP